MMAEEAKQTGTHARKRQRRRDSAGPKGGIELLPQQSKEGSKLALKKRKRAAHTVVAPPCTVKEGAAVAAHTPAQVSATKKRAPLHTEQRHEHTGAVATGLGAQAAATPGRTAKGWATCCCWWQGHLRAGSVDITNRQQCHTLQALLCLVVWRLYCT